MRGGRKKDENGGRRIVQKRSSTHPLTPAVVGQRGKDKTYAGLGGLSGKGEKERGERAKRCQNKGQTLGEGE